MFEPVPALENAQLQAILCKLLASHLKFPGRNVDVLTTKTAGFVAQPFAFVTPKIDGQRFLLFGHAQGGATALYFVDQRFQFTRAGVLPRGPKSFLLDGERLGGDVAGAGQLLAPAYHVFDVLLFKGVAVFHRRGLLDRLKLLDPLLPALRRAVGEFMDVQLKRIFAARQSLGAVKAELDLLSYPTDGVVVIDGRAGGLSYKWKPVDRITVDFVVGWELDPNTRDARQLYVAEEWEAQPKNGEVRGSGQLYTSDQSFDDALTGQIWECSYVAEAEAWKLLRPRPDKTTANGRRVLERNLALIRDALTFDMLLQQCEVDPGVAAAFLPEPECKSRASAAAADAAPVQRRKRPPKDAPQQQQHAGAGHNHGKKAYFSTGAVRRQDSPSQPTKTYHNTVVKQHLYRGYVRGRTSLLELGIGRGCDGNRTRDAGQKLKVFVGVDADKSAVVECRRRWWYVQKLQKLAAEGKKVPNHPALKNHCNPDVVDMDVLDLNDLAACRNFFDKRRLFQFDTVMCHFALHYFPDTAVSLVQACVKPDGYFVATLFDRASLDAVVPEVGDRKQWFMDVDGEQKLQAEVTRQSRGTATVFVDTIGQRHEEHIVDVADFVHKLGPEFEVVRPVGAQLPHDWRGPTCSFKEYAHHIRTDFYGPSHPMWTFTSMYQVLVVRRKGLPSATPETIHIETEQPAHAGYGNYQQPHGSYNEPSYAANRPRSPNYSAKSPQYSADSPQYQPRSPDYSAKSPQYSADSPQYQPRSPDYSAKSLQYSADSPQYQPRSPDYSAKSLQYRSRRSPSRSPSPDYGD